jgi:quinol monooxygenase YgiN
MIMQKVIVLFHCRPGKGKDLLSTLAEILGDTRAYDGCISVETFVDADNPDTIMIIEDWETRTQNESYNAWRAETGIAETLTPILSAPPQTRYLETYPI